MQHFKTILLLIGLSILFVSCKENVDLLLTNATIYTVDSAFSKATTMVVKDGKIVAIGNEKDLSNKYKPQQTIDAQGQFVYPGFIDAHTHFFRYGGSLEDVNLVNTSSWEAVLDSVSAYSKHHNYEWIIGRGWDQNDWKEKKYPTNKELNELFPDKPVFLRRIDGHAAIANAKALSLAGIKVGQSIPGGKIITENGVLTGILIDNAVDLVAAKLPTDNAEKIKKGLQMAQAECFSYGLTSVQDCGLDYKEVELLQEEQKKGNIKMRTFVMLSDNAKNFDWLRKNGIIKNDKVQVRGFKVYADGALGSRGACLLHPYDDQKNWSGFLLSNPQHFDSVAKVIYENKWQMCTHAIGDSSNRAMLHIYAKYLKGKNDLRWRIEHAQVVDSSDFHWFGDYNIIPSVQPTHATSDMYWAVERLGKKRLQNAYAYKKLMQENGWIPLGTDFPVESISPFKTFVSAVFRQDAKGFPEAGFQKENALSAIDALRGMTIWAAKAAFEEKEKGSLEVGKFADFIIIDTDLIKADAATILKAKVLKTFVGGDLVYSR